MTPISCRPASRACPISVLKAAAITAQREAEISAKAGATHYSRFETVSFHRQPLLPVCFSSVFFFFFFLCVRVLALHTTSGTFDPRPPSNDAAMPGRRSRSFCRRRIKTKRTRATPLRSVAGNRARVYGEIVVSSSSSLFAAHAPTRSQPVPKREIVWGLRP